MARHNERCKNCKIAVEKLLNAIFGDVRTNYNLNLPAKVNDYSDSALSNDLFSIHTALQDHRNHKKFVKTRKLSPVDFYVPDPGLVVEFDESQHFTLPRKISLLNYPDSLDLGFDKDRWINLCNDLNKKDGDPPYRDEQRAWYDSIRDFAPAILDIKSTIRIFSRDYVWCSLSHESESDKEIFKTYISISNDGNL
tara:strand:+ start:115 stop:699 length:585 start_codon:yes stop_codon:yes gene_type:complete